MSVDPLNTALSGLEAYGDALDVAANNVANVGTTGFKSQMVNLQDVAGGGVTVASISTDPSQGGLAPTGAPTNVAISGRGFFVLQSPNGGTPLYTRNGNFSVDANGDLVDPSTGLEVMGVGQGGAVQAISIPPGVQSITVGANGSVIGVFPDGQQTQLGTIALATFQNAGGLARVSGGYQETAASGAAQVGAPATAGYGSLVGGMLESSNVDLANQFVNMIAAQAAFEANAKTVEVAEQTSQTTLNLDG